MSEDGATQKKKRPRPVEVPDAPDLPDAPEIYGLNERAFDQDERNWHQRDAVEELFRIRRQRTAERWAVLALSVGLSLSFAIGMRLRASGGKPSGVAIAPEPGPREVELESKLAACVAVQPPPCSAAVESSSGSASSQSPWAKSHIERRGRFCAVRCGSTEACYARCAAGYNRCGILCPSDPASKCFSQCVAALGSSMDDAMPLDAGSSAGTRDASPSQAPHGP